MQSLRNLIQNDRRFKLLAGAIVCALAVFAILNLIPETGFRVVKTNPALNKVTYFAPFLKLEYSEPLVKESVSVPQQSVVKSYSVSDKTLTITLNALDIGKKYTVLVSSVTSKNGNTLTNQKYSFKAKDGEWSRLPEDQRKAVLSEQDKKPATASDPILAFLPHETPTFKLTAVVGSKPDGSPDLSLRADILPAFADTLSDGSVPIETIDQYKKEVTDYISSVGLNPANYVISYTVVNPYVQPH